MNSNQIAIREYVRTVYKIHKLTMEKLDYFVSLPSLYCSSLNEIRDSNDIISKVYLMNGYMKSTILKFYNDYVKDLDSFSTTYCEKYSVSKPNLDTDLWIFNYEIKSTIQLIENKLDTKSVMAELSNQQVIAAIQQLFESIDVLMALETKLNTVPNYDRLNVLKGSNFAFFKSNQLLLKVENIFNHFPQSGSYIVTKPYFKQVLEKLKN